jgi:hypothetical protein
MAQRVTIFLEDDIDGSEASATLAFSFEGRDYEIDLSDKNAAKFRKAVGPFVEKSRIVRGQRGKQRARAGSTTGSDAAAIREWAKTAGYDVPARGTVPKDIRTAYEAAHAA